MGCTNVGKSSLFNALIQSDFCKPDVADIVQKATISQWPGTTLNLLKVLPFFILNRIYLVVVFLKYFIYEFHLYSSQL